jgi:hypothetical protein
VEKLHALGWGGTKGSTDQKEGFYGGPELNPEDEYPWRSTPTYGWNRFPDEHVPEMGRRCWNI